MKMPTPSFQELVSYHEDLAELFFKHQEALLNKKVDEAVRLLQKYKAALERHIKDEEEIMMPFYEQQAKIPTGGDPRLFKGDHRNLLKMLEEYEAPLSQLDPTHENWSRDLLAMLDMEGQHKRLLSHHDEREQSLFFPALDKATSDEERTSILNQCALRIE